MLAIPSNWSDRTPERVVTHVLQQAYLAGLYQPVTSLLTHACLEQLVESRGWDEGSEPLKVRTCRYGFRINDGLFHVLTQVDDETPRILRKLGRMRLMTTVLAPPWSSQVAAPLYQCT